MNTRHTIAGIGLGIGLGIAGIAGTAAAAPHTAGGFDAAKAKCVAAIDTRLDAITALGRHADSAPLLTDTHQTTIDGFLSDSRTGLTGLRAEVAADTDPTALRDDCEHVTADYRIYALRSPQVHLAVAGGRQAVAVRKGAGLADALGAAIDTDERLGRDVTTERALLDDMRTQLATASSQLDGTVDAALTITPAQWNGDHAALTPTSDSLRAAQHALKAAFADAAKIVAGLEG